MATALDRLLDLLDRAEALEAERSRKGHAAKKKPNRTQRPRTGTQSGLEAARQLRATRRAIGILRQGGWVQEEIAVDRDGQPVPADSPDAAAWCLDGAIHLAVIEQGQAGSVASERRIGMICGQLLRAAGKKGNRDRMNQIQAVAELNDHELQTKEEAIALLEQAAAAIEHQLEERRTDVH